MKTIFSKRFMAPLAVMILGGAGAFVTTSMNSTKTLANVTGYRYVSQQDPCHADIQCTTDNNGVICTSGSSQLFQKINENACDLPLYKIPNP